MELSKMSDEDLIDLEQNLYDTEVDSGDPDWWFHREEVLDEMRLRGMLDQKSK